jgi:hypothetical protein
MKLDNLKTDQKYELLYFCSAWTRFCEPDRISSLVVNREPEKVYTDKAVKIKDKRYIQM